MSFTDWPKSEPWCWHPWSSQSVNQEHPWTSFLSQCRRCSLKCWHHPPLASPTWRNEEKPSRMNKYHFVKKILQSKMYNSCRICMRKRDSMISQTICVVLKLICDLDEELLLFSQLPQWCTDITQTYSGVKKCCLVSPQSIFLKVLEIIQMFPGKTETSIYVPFAQQWVLSWNCSAGHFCQVSFLLWSHEQ